MRQLARSPLFYFGRSEAFLAPETTHSLGQLHANQDICLPLTHYRWYMWRDLPLEMLRKARIGRCRRILASGSDWSSYT